MLITFIKLARQLDFQDFHELDVVYDLRHQLILKLSSQFNVVHVIIGVDILGN